MMKHLLFTLLIVLAVSGCSHDVDPGDPEMLNIEVDEFVSQLKDGTYGRNESNSNGMAQWLYLPAFTMQDIPALIGFAEDTCHIKSFPVAPFSSYWIDDFVLGECLLWTVEGIRKGDKYFSLVPWINKDGNRASQQDILEVRELYRKWWLKVDGSPARMKELDPLAETTYAWQ